MALSVLPSKGLPKPGDLVGSKYRIMSAIGSGGMGVVFEAVHIEGPKGRVENIRLIAPHRPGTQVEISQTDALVLGIKPPIRDSGKLDGTPGVRIIGPKGALEVKQGLIIARRHIHLHPLEAQAMGVKDGEVVRVRAGIGGARELVYEQVLCRVSDQFSLELHVDTDEANAAWLKSGDNVHLV